MIEQVGGWHVCVPGRLHTCASGPLQVCGFVGQVCDTPLQVWGRRLPQPGLLQVPSVRHCEGSVHGFCDQGWPFCFEQVPGVAEHCPLEVQPAPPSAHVPP